MFDSDGVAQTRPPPAHGQLEPSFAAAAAVLASVPSRVLVASSGPRPAGGRPGCVHVRVERRAVIRCQRAGPGLAGVHCCQCGSPNAHLERGKRQRGGLAAPVLCGALDERGGHGGHGLPLPGCATSPALVPPPPPGSTPVPRQRQCGPRARRLESESLSVARELVRQSRSLPSRLAP